MFDVISVRQARSQEMVGRSVCLQGWIRTRRDSKGGFSFLELNDGSCLSSMQVIANADLANYESDVLHLTAGCSVSVQGTIQASLGEGQLTELQAVAVTVHGQADPQAYPLQKKRHTFEKLREWAHLRPRTNAFGAVTRVRNRISYAIHQFFQSEEFLYVHTPIITASDCEGAGRLFRVTTLDPENPPRRDGHVDYAQDFFERPSYLTVSGQLNAEIFACSMGRVYTFGPTFRAENSQTSRHLAEFWMVEPEMAFFDLEANMALAERFLKTVIADVLVECREDIEFFNQRVDPHLNETLQGILAGPFERLSYTAAVDILTTCGQTFEFPVAWGTDLQSEHERYLTETHFRKPVILYDYPRTLKPFYMRVNDDGRTVRAMDVLVPQIGEVIGGSQREERLDVLTARMQEQGLDPTHYWWYLELRQFGTVPHAGFGLGLERLIQLVTGMANIRDVIPFPRTPGNADF